MRALTAWLKRRLLTADAVYGLILYSALIAVASGDHGNSLEVFAISAFSLLVFWGAHVYAGTIANHGVRDGEEIHMSQAFREAVGHASGMLYAAVLPSIVVLLGAFPILSYSASVDDALLLVLIMLGVIGYESFHQRRSRMVVRIFGAIGTALFGLIMIILNTTIH
jgi:hypothetical protein